MSAADRLDAQVNHVAMMLVVMGGPTALAPFQGMSRFDCMAQELKHALLHTSGADMASLLGDVARDSGSAVLRRVTGLLHLAGNLGAGAVSELEGMIKAYAKENLAQHMAKRVSTISAITEEAVTNGAKSLSSLIRDLIAHPAEAGPKLLVLVLSSIATSGGVDGNGGAPDLDIPLMGIGEHRSPFTHSILIGSLLETALLLLTRIVICTHKNLPGNHDPLWEGIAGRSVEILNAAGKGASIGIAYHLMVDAVAQPGAYHGMPFDLPMEAHQTIFAANSVAETTSVKTYPTEETLRTTPEILALHKKYRSIPMPIPSVLQAMLSPADISLLLSYGAWMQALAKRIIAPTSMAQVQFLKVADGNRTPTSSHEIAWMALVNAKQRAGWTHSVRF